MKGWIGIVAAAMLLCVGCKTEKGPGESLEKYLNAAQQGNYSEFLGGLSYSGFDSENGDSLTIYLMDANKKLLEERYGGVKSYEIVNVTLNDDGNAAIVRVKINFGNEISEETEYEMIKEGDVWKINLAS